MSRFYSYLHSAVTMLEEYTGAEPFATFSKKYFARFKKFGSRDRKLISHLCYCYFRTGKSLRALSVEDRLTTGLFFCSDAPNEMLETYRPEWNRETHLSLEEKFHLCGLDAKADAVFPWPDELSEGMDKELFTASFFQQPSLFIRIRPGKKDKVMAQLKQAAISFDLIRENAIALKPGTNIDGLLAVNTDVVIQDLSSQRVGELMTLAEKQDTTPFTVWDCCAASGGKSLLAYDLLRSAELTVSDIRESVLMNLKKRFAEAGIRKYQLFATDLSSGDTFRPPPALQGKHPFDLVLADVPCSGSGTWSRTPEQLFYFEKERINAYAALQQKILSRVVPFVKPGGYLLYSTCSVFHGENERILSFLKAQFHLRVVKMELLKGYSEKADTMFAALLQRSE
ncbi:MAG: Fmu (Sun) domain-containing protein [Bacteroidetes bacterium]|nr:Fmu (Sun) domain-containing protein [Bacteroidota bacterium]